MASYKDSFFTQFNDKFDQRLEGGMSFKTDFFMEFMRAQLVAYDKAVEAEERLMTMDEFRNKWLGERIELLDASDICGGTEDDFKEAKIAQAKADVIAEMINDLNYIVPDEE